MEYKIKIPKGCVSIDLLCVAHLMAMNKTTIGGDHAFHEQTYRNIYDRLCLTLLDEVNKNKLRVCNADGIEVSSEQLISNMQIINKYNSIPNWDDIKKKFPECEVDGSGCFNFTGVDVGLGEPEPDLVGSELRCYSSTIKQLNDWGNGANVFVAIEMPIDMVTFDSIDSNMNLIEADFYRGFAGYAEDNTIKEANKPQSVQRWREDEILRVIGELGYSATNLPINKAGKRGVKADVKEKLISNKFTKSMFYHAWDELRSDKRIKE